MSPPDIPFRSSIEWQAVCDRICELASRVERECGPVVRKMSQLFNWVSPLLDELCQQTCPGCSDICCSRATVWFDSRDLLFMRLAGYPLPTVQLERNEDGRCARLGAAGCDLIRGRRPFVCTWYLCPAQKALIRKRRGEFLRLGEMLEELKRLRRVVWGVAGDNKASEFLLNTVSV